MSLKHNHQRGFSFNSHLSLTSHVSQSSLFSVLREEEISKDDFTVVNSNYKQIQESKSNLEFKETYHRLGYRIAMPNLCKLISSTDDIIKRSNGYPIKKQQVCYVSVIGKTHKPQKLRKVVLANSKLKVYKISDDGGEKKEASFTLQRLTDIKYLSDSAKNVSLVFDTKKEKRQGMMARLRNRTMSNASFSRSSFRKGKTTVTLKEQGSAVIRKSTRESTRRTRRITSTTKRRKVRNTSDNESLLGSKHGRGARFTKRRKDEGNNLRIMKIPSLSRQNSLTNTAPQQRNLLLKNDDNSYVKIVQQEIELTFNTPEECQEWVVGVLVETENQAKIFQTYISVLDDKQKDNYEILLRKAVDLLTVAKGVRDIQVWRLREQLADFLNNEGKYEEAKIWYNLSLPNREDITILDLIENARIERKRDKHTIDRMSHRSFSSFGSMFQVDIDQEKRVIAPPASKDIAIDAITLFLKQYAAYEDLDTAREDAKALVEADHYLGIARKLEAKYARVPEGFEFYLIAAGKTPLEKMRMRAEEYDDLVV